MKKEECIFCNFKDKEVLVYDDDLCYAIISKDPINDYHVLIIPKKHYKNFIELPDKLASHVFLVAKKISKAVREACNPDAVTHLFDDDISKEGYNMVSHYKFHIIPRFKKDLLMIDWSPLRNKNLGIKARSKFANDIKRRLR
jgi:histidine triad (HIT) family protein